MNHSNAKNPFEPQCLATTIGSLPHIDVPYGTELIFKNTPEIPGWVQFPKRGLHENMMVQFTEGMPGLEGNNQTVFFNTQSDDFVSQITDFYTYYLDVIENNDINALNKFKLSAEYAAGFSEFIDHLSSQPRTDMVLKGQVTGPFTLGMNLMDQNNKCSYFDDQLHDIVVKASALKAIWQIENLSDFNRQIIILLDEPSLINFGTQVCITVTREEIIRDINEVSEAIHSRGAMAGVHCEANTDWSILMETDLDILVFDAYDHMQSITLYPEYLKNFLKKGGSLGWGIVPTLDREAAAKETLDSLLNRFENSLDQLSNTGFDRNLLLRRALLTPSCGAGGVLTEQLAEHVLSLLKQLSETLRNRYGFDFI